MTTITSITYFSLAIGQRPQVGTRECALYDSLRSEFSPADALRVLESRGEKLLVVIAEVVNRAKRRHGVTV